MIGSDRVIGIDLFSGAGGFTLGFTRACERLGIEAPRAVAINHWDIAISTHSKNFPDFDHYQASVEDVNPREVVGDETVNLLVAGPSCVYFSRARGGRPVNDQQRVSPWLILSWLEQLDVRAFIIENVPDLMNWGPVDPKTGRPIQKLKGKTFLSYLQALRSLGYHVQYRVLTCADYGDPTTRQRLFIMGRKGSRVKWPEPTHARDPQPTMFGTQKKWVSAREIIDLSIRGESIFRRKRPLHPNTLRRIEAGLRKFSGLPFLLKYYGTSDVSDVGNPVPTITAQGDKFALIQPFVITVGGPEGQGRNPKSVDGPLPTVLTNDRHALVQPVLGDPVIIPLNHGSDDLRAYPVDEPMRTITSVDAWGLVQPSPEPFPVQFNGAADAQPVDQPVGALTTKDRFGLAQPIVEVEGKKYKLDILFRMLTPPELARAHSMDNYEFVGTRADIVKQIGNSVPAKTAEALCYTQLRWQL